MEGWNFKVRLCRDFGCNITGLPVLWNYNGNKYGYMYDGVGNITGLIDETSSDSNYGKKIVTYIYGVFGNVIGHSKTTNSGLETANPFIQHGYSRNCDICEKFTKDKFLQNENSCQFYG